MTESTKDERLFHEVEDKIKKAIFGCGLINGGNRILVGLSGGKDSLALVGLLGRRSKIYYPWFEVVIAHIVMTGTPYCSDREYLRSCVEEHGLPFIVRKASFDPSTNTRKSPCFLCSQTRRKALFEITKVHKCNRTALGHRQDDIPETSLMNLTHQGVSGTVPLRLRMDKFDMEIIHSMCLVEERELIQVVTWKGYRRQLKSCPYEPGSSRSNMKELLRSLETINPGARYSFWGSMTNIQEDYLSRKIR